MNQGAETPQPPPDPGLELTQDNYPELGTSPPTASQGDTPEPRPQRRYPARRRRPRNTQGGTGPTPRADPEGTTEGRAENDEDNGQEPTEDRGRNPTQETLDTQEGSTRTLQYPNINDAPNGRKSNWTLHPERKIVILGDSNLCRIPAHTREDVQIECYPGMKLGHAGQVLAKTNRTQEVSHCIISAGINNRDQDKPLTGIKELRIALLRARETFPTASIHVPLINYSERLPTKQKLNLRALNKEIEKGNHIPKLEERDFKIDPKDNKFHIHWSMETAQAMLENWLRSLN